MSGLFKIIVVSLIPICGYCQLIDNFSDGNFDSNPIWTATEGHFIVNEDFKLQLNAPDGGSSFIHTPISLADSIRWSANVLMDFAPSGSNNLKIILAADEFSENAANALYFEIGESGSDDAIQLIESNNGVETMLASATMGGVGADPADFVFTLEKNADDIWSLFVDYNQTGTQLEWESNLTINWLPTAVMFGFFMEYTSTRTDKYFFDDISVTELLPDMEAPSVSGQNLIDNNKIVLEFSEQLDPATLDQLENYSITPDIGNPISVSYDPENTSVCELTFSTPLNSGIVYSLDVAGLTDLAGNELIPFTQEIFLWTVPDIGDLVVNEILFNPTTEGFDFVEIYNNSDKFIDLSTISIANLQKDLYKEISFAQVITPGEYMVFCMDTDWLANEYSLNAPLQVWENDLPSFNDDEGNVSIVHQQMDGSLLTIDSLDYFEDWHYPLLDDEEGVSLERLSFGTPTNEQSNWYSAAGSAGFATPGYVNSQNIIDNGEVGISILEKVFSPNQDGDKDQLVLNYKLDKPGYLGTIRVFNDRGFFVTELADNLLLSNEGFLLWDGTKNNSQRAAIGIYLITYEMVHPDGDTMQGKLSCVLADFLD